MAVNTQQTSVSRQMPAELVGPTTFLLKRLAWRRSERSMAAYEQVGLHPYHYAILLVLDDGSRETQGEIDVLGYAIYGLVGLLDELEERDLVERHRDPNDRRRHVVHLTPDGKRTLGAFGRSRARSRTSSSLRSARTNERRCTRSCSDWRKSTSRRAMARRPPPAERGFRVTQARRRLADGPIPSVQATGAQG